ncbi:NADH-quinone oxidoreductase subunit NuoF family protein [Streptomyces sp. WMMB 322]|uniref:NADH-quinone oxidoreductase subunit NuoF family protein n=1 Tax=Streptomyces sp. WMMB 322 TaxID=1286821 RepID=UPI0006E401FA|nr:NADH-quinone oxidoreductase subunit NuoF family protein [Streptomyces sp. WMMB 322]SCK44344.1 NADH:ubiquinone oxidoreductase, NADH-binding subunit (chain F) [Streptomyces sp. WMMB 322]
MTALVPSPVSAGNADSVPSLASFGPPRLLAGLGTGAGWTRRLERVGHLTVHGTMPELRLEELVDLAENIDLRGRGGAGFPFAKKLKAVIESAHRRQQARAAVVVNGSEGEPSCLKDTALLLFTPHLVLDGAMLCARALNSDEVSVAVTRPDVERSVRDAVAERGPEGPRIRVVRMPERFVTGESSSIVSGLNQLPVLPSGSGVRASDAGVAGMPTLLSNTETFAQLAVGARLGALDFRNVGLPTEPGTVLLTVSGDKVVETPTGAPLPYILGLCGIDPGQGVLIGGYHGRFLERDSCWQARISRDSLEAMGSTLGAGAVLALPEGTCPVGEVELVARWMAEESAGQCGPCFLGLPAIADTIAWAADGGGMEALEAIRARTKGVKKRGACSHPDGTARFVESALESFAEDFEEHALGSGCGRPVFGSLAVPEQVQLAAGYEPPARPERARRAAPKLQQKQRRLVVDWTLCQGHGLCAGVVPDMIELDIDGYPMGASATIHPHMQKQAQRAVRRCPALALRIVER